MKKLLITVAVVLALALTCLTGCFMQPSSAELESTATSVFTIDANPGVKVYLSAENEVIAIEGTNTDGEQIAEEVDVVGDSAEAATEEIVDEMFEQGFIDENNSVLVSYEKEKDAPREAVKEKIERVFERRGKTPCIIEQDIENIAEDEDKELREIEKKHRISRGKARLIEKILEQNPELTLEELKELAVNDLALMLNEDSKEHFEWRGKPDDSMYQTREAAVAAVLAAAGVEADEVYRLEVELDLEDGKMVFEVEFRCDGVAYEYELDAETLEILDNETKVLKGEEEDERDNEGGKPNVKEPKPEGEKCGEEDEPIASENTEDVAPQNPEKAEQGKDRSGETLSNSGEENAPKDTPRHKNA